MKEIIEVRCVVCGLTGANKVPGGRFECIHCGNSWQRIESFAKW